MNIGEAIKTVTEHQDLRFEDMVSVMTDIMTGNTTDAQNAAFLVGLQMKGIKVSEILGGVSVMRKLSTKVVVDVNRSNLVDTCGTGGSGSNKFNVSTMRPAIKPVHNSFRSFRRLDQNSCKPINK